MEKQLKEAKVTYPDLYMYIKTITILQQLSINSDRFKKSFLNNILGNHGLQIAKAWIDSNTEMIYDIWNQTYR